MLGRYICSTYSFSRRTFRGEAGLVLKNVANLCRLYLPRRYLPGGGRQIVGRPHSWIMYFTLKMFASLHRPNVPHLPLTPGAATAAYAREETNRLVTFVFYETNTKADWGSLGTAPCARI